MKIQCELCVMTVINGTENHARLTDTKINTNQHCFVQVITNFNMYPVLQICHKRGGKYTSLTLFYPEFYNIHVFYRQQPDYMKGRRPCEQFVKYQYSSCSSYFSDKQEKKFKLNL